MRYTYSTGCRKNSRRRAVCRRPNAPDRRNGIPNEIKITGRIPTWQNVRLHCAETLFRSKARNSKQATPHLTSNLQERTDTGLKDIHLSDFAGRTLLLSVVPSVDTPVCAMQTKKFNTQAAQLPDSVAVVTVSTDLPFAQARFCGAEGVDKLECASDHRDVSFGKSYGVLIADGPMARILARSIFVVGPDGNFKHVEYVPEISDEPNYDAALAAVAK